jgi:hypothetical protein
VALVLLIPGAISAIFSRLTGEIEAERLWDTISPAAQEILFSDTDPEAFLSHAVLGTYLMYAFVALAAWRVLLEIWTKLKRTQPVYLVVAMLAIVALLYQSRATVRIQLAPPISLGFRDSPLSCAKSPLSCGFYDIRDLHEGSRARLISR